MQCWYRLLFLLLALYYCYSYLLLLVSTCSLAYNINKHIMIITDPARLFSLIAVRWSGCQVAEDGLDTLIGMLPFRNDGMIILLT